MKLWVEKMLQKFIQNMMEENLLLLKELLEPLNNKIFKYMTWISKNVYIDKLDDIVNKCNNIYHRTTKTKFVDVKPSIYFDFHKENNNNNNNNNNFNSEEIVGTFYEIELQKSNQKELKK